MSGHAAGFFDAQFRRQLAAGELALNPFEQQALPRLRGRVLDFGCGLGNLALAAARRGLAVEAVDASPAAIAHLQAAAGAERLPIAARCADALDFAWPAGCWDSVVSIGLLMFLDCEHAFALLERMAEHTCAGGTLVVNVLARGTTWLEPFGDDPHCLFDDDALPGWFAARGFAVDELRCSEFAAPGGTVKRFVTVAATAPAG